MKTLISGHYRDQHGRTYNLNMEPAIVLGEDHYLIQREISIEVWRVYN
jgi:hypothetical protein